MMAKHSQSIKISAMLSVTPMDHKNKNPRLFLTEGFYGTTKYHHLRLEVELERLEDDENRIFIVLFQYILQI